MEEKKIGKPNPVSNDPESEYERLRSVENAQREKITKLRGQIANQELMIEKMRKENEKLKERTRVYAQSRPDPDLELALRMSEYENPVYFQGPSGLSEAEIDVIPKQSLPMFAIDASSQCCVCKEFIPVDHIVKSLPFCGHLGHQPCMDQWLLQKTTCPECSIPIRN